MAQILREQPRSTPWVFPNARTGRPYTTIANSFRRALERAGITTGDVTLHTLRHTALSRIIDEGYDDYTVMAISGHSSTRMLARYTHPTEERKIGALEASNVGTIWAHDDDPSSEEPDDALDFLRKNGGRQGTRTLGLRVANAALSQLS